MRGSGGFVGQGLLLLDEYRAFILQTPVASQGSSAYGDIVREGYPIVFIEEAEVDVDHVSENEEMDPDYIRPDLAETYRRHAFTLDENRPEAVEKRYGRGYRMPRENIAQLMDDGSFKEYWPLIVARQHKRFDMETLRKNTPADGLLAGIGTINADLFDDVDARAMLVHYDYTVLAGTQGGRNHYKQDRMFELAHRFRIPLVLFGEGGGGRPGDDGTGPGVAFDTHVAGSTLTLGFSPRLNYLLNVQYDNFSDSVGLNHRIRWTRKPGDEMFLVVNHEADVHHRWTPTVTEAKVKAGWTFSF